LEKKNLCNFPSKMGGYWGEEGEKKRKGKNWSRAALRFGQSRQQTTFKMKKKGGRKRHCPFVFFVGFKKKKGRVPTKTKKTGQKGEKGPRGKKRKREQNFIFL